MNYRCIAIVFSVLACAATVRAQDTRLQTEPVFRPGTDLLKWSVLFERDDDRYRKRIDTVVEMLPGGQPRALIPGGFRVAVGIAAPLEHEDLSGLDEIHIWVRAGASLTAQPFSQSSGFVFRDGGDRDVRVPGDGSPVLLRIRRTSIADPSMVQSIGVQVRPRAGGGPAMLEIAALTAIPRAKAEASTLFRISPLDVASTIPRHSIYTADFTLSRTYENPYDPAEIDVQAEFQLASGGVLTVPAFWYQEFTVAPGSENAWRTARRPCSIEVEAKAGYPVTSPTA